MGSGPGVLELPAQPSANTRARAGILALVLYSFAHFWIDLYASALGALQPLLVEKLRLSLTQAGLAGGVLIFSSSVTQPLYGYLSDRFHSRLFSALAPAVAGIFICSLGIAPAYGWVLLAVVLGGAGISSFHPQASARAAQGVVSNRGKWFAVFISAGTLGMALGPAAFSIATRSLGMERLLWGALPGIAATILLLTVLPPTPAPPVAHRNRFDWEPLRAVWKPMTVLYFLVFIRSIVQITFAQFLPLYLSRERGFSLPHANYTLSIYLTAGAIGGFIGGHLSDRFGGRNVILASMIGSVPFLTLFFVTSGWMALLGLALGGLILLFTIPVNVVMAQDLVPSQAGTVSALMMGFSWGMAGLIFIPLTGWVADHASLHMALFSLAVFPVIGFFLTLKLPR
jgi:FSR family fosmidomycin resistance protein-like MFS transporter